MTTPQEVSMQDVRKELNFCAKTKIRVIGVLENMNQLLIPLSHLNFVERKTGRDQTEYVRGVLQQCDLQQCDASITIFQCALDNSPQSMAARFNVPYLGALPLDPSLQRACESGTCLVCQCQQHSPAFTPFVRLVDTMLSIITANKAKIPRHRPIKHHLSPICCWSQLVFTSCRVAACSDFGVRLGGAVILVET